jgi:hypothetical protein
MARRLAWPCCRTRARLPFSTMTVRGPTPPTPPDGGRLTPTPASRKGSSGGSHRCSPPPLAAAGLKAVGPCGGPACFRAPSMRVDQPVWVIVRGRLTQRRELSRASEAHPWRPGAGAELRDGLVGRDPGLAGGADLAVCLLGDRQRVAGSHGLVNALLGDRAWAYLAWVKMSVELGVGRRRLLSVSGWSGWRTPLRAPQRRGLPWRRARIAARAVALSWVPDSRSWRVAGRVAGTAARGWVGGRWWGGQRPGRAPARRAVLVHWPRPGRCRTSGRPRRSGRWLIKRTVARPGVMLSGS